MNYHKLNKFKLTQLSNFKFYRDGKDFTFAECWDDYVNWITNACNQNTSMDKAELSDFIDFLFDGREMPVIKFMIENGDFYLVSKDGIEVTTTTEAKQKKHLSFSAAIKLARKKIKEAQDLGNKFPVQAGVNVMDNNGYSFDDTIVDKKTKRSVFIYSHPLSGNTVKLKD